MKFTLWNCMKCQMSKIVRENCNRWRHTLKLLFDFQNKLGFFLDVSYCKALKIFLLIFGIKIWWVQRLFWFIYSQLKIQAPPHAEGRFPFPCENSTAQTRTKWPPQNIGSILPSSSSGRSISMEDSGFSGSIVLCVNFVKSVFGWL